MKTRKHIAIVISILVLVANLGLAFNVHYCGDSVASVSLSSLSKPVDEKDCCGKVIEKSSCCKDKKIQIEKKIDHSIVKSFSFQMEIPLEIYEWKLAIFEAQVKIKRSQLLHYTCNANAPPLYKLYSQYILYA